jgi:Glycosyl hydrolases family 39
MARLKRAITAGLLAGQLLFGGTQLRERLTAPSAMVPATLFGMHMHHAGDTTPWPAVSFGAWRLWDAYVSWSDLEPQRGRFQFERLDQYVGLAQEHHVEVLLVFGLTPAWASARPGEKSPYKPGNAAEPRELEDWRRFVAAVAGRYKGRIAAYEIWNEPDLKQTWTGSVEQMVALAREASQVVRAIDPGARIVSPAVAGVDVNWLAEFLAKGGGQYVDVIGYHFYVTPKPPEAMLPLIRQVKQVMAEHGAGAKPLWNTETGWADPKPFPSEELAAAYVARSYILNWAAGVERLYWYAWDNHRWVTLEMTEADERELRLAAKAYAVMQEWLVGAQLKGCEEDENHTWVCALKRGGRAEWIVWNAKGSRSFAVPESWHASRTTRLLKEGQSLTGTTIEIGPVPVLVTAPPNLSGAA